jgi:hypothetical protein
VHPYAVAGVGRELPVKALQAWWGTVSVRAKWGGFFALVGAGFTVALAFLGSAEKPPTASEQAVIALLAIFAQFGAAWTFSREGRADPAMAQRSVARLVRLAQRAQKARRQAEDLAVRGTPAPDLRDCVGYLSVHLSYLEEGYVEAIDDWRAFHPRAVDAAESAIERTSVDDE